MAGPIPPGQGSASGKGAHDELPASTDQPRIRHALGGIRELVLVSLLARHLESTSRRPIFRDEKATELANRLELAAKRFPQLRRAHLATTIRTDLIDGVTQAHLEGFEDATVVTFGAGLCTRYFRLTAPQAQWIDIDLPNVAALRNELLATTAPNRSVIASSVLDPRWGESLRHRRSESTLFIAEGLLMFMDPGDVRALITRLADRYPGAELIVESVRTAATGQPHPLAPDGGELRWTVDDFAEVAGWTAGITVVDQWSFLDRHPFVKAPSGGQQWLRRLRKGTAEEDPRILLGHLRFES